ncbi:ComEA family DNA-binding protein [Caenimonas koreensis]|uniref:ComEA family DNA-binding protein n=1 Tax=Caenimonas koreensis TaxID=367474 RepID=UPI00378481E6
MLKKILAIVAMLYAAATFAAVDVNKATAADLDGIKGIGPSISAKIIDERKKGSFKDWQDFIDRVKGVGEGNAAKFSAEGLTVNGSAFKGAAAAPAAPAKKDEKPAAVAKEEKKDAKAAAADEKKAAKETAKEEKAAAKKEAKEEKKAAEAKKDAKVEKAEAKKDEKTAKAEPAAAASAAASAKK